MGILPEKFILRPLKVTVVPSGQIVYTFTSCSPAAFGSKIKLPFPKGVIFMFSDSATTGHSIQPTFMLIVSALDTSNL